ncbi:membrane protein insertase YidC [Pokkaliibacter sp. MBI-7]|uniref:membrane protein insertase YidC n=1 Tax=Pokkaliibacter sp. MBI-7 TaxID=3040600 RepID=UPI00244B02B0|nr:membrane protein insertase YidC [Pokkaliibacter sp. MBI-7]MDH2433144.1 membrane protein insertase YidC [Pokkaliibacter sp. MBI-7]
MDVQRMILVGALALISYTAVLKWNEDYGQPAAAASVAQTVSSADMPSAQPATNASDLPSTGAAATTTDVASSKPTNSLISVHTDVLDLRIDPHGGDVLYAALPNHKERVDTPAQPLVLLENNGTHTYIAQSGLVGTNGPDANADGRPQYSVAATSYTLGKDDKSLDVDLNTTTAEGVKVTKRFTFTAGSNLIKVTYLIDNQSQQPFSANMFGQLKRDNAPDPSQQHGMGMRSYLGPVFSTQSERYQKVTFKDLDEGDKFKQESTGGWVAMLQHYFLTAWIPTEGDSKQNTYEARKSGSNYIAGFVEPAVTVAAGQKGEISAGLYIGPKDQDVLRTVAPNLNLTVDYGWLWFIGQPLFAMLKFFHSIVSNWGIAIILTTMVVKGIFFYPSAMSYRSMAKMRKFAPEMQRMKEMYGDDRQKMSQAMMELYRKEKINPLGGCLPILIQMPVFIALYWVLSESVELRHAPFYGWIHDMSVMDPYFILPIIMGCTMFLQQRLNPTPPDPMQAKVMKFLPVIFTFFFLWFPAGLVLYWVVNNCLSILQQYIITRKIENEGKTA